MTARAAQAAETKQRLVDAAVRLFSELDYDKVGVSELVEEADVAHGLLFHYFGNKRGIYLEAMRVTAADLTRAFTNVRATTPAGQIREALTAHLRYLRQHRGLALRLVLGGRGADPEAWAVFEDARTAALTYAAQLLSLDPDNPGLRMAGRCAVAAIDEATVQWLEDEDQFNIDQMVEWAVHLIVGCLRSAELLDPTLTTGPAIQSLLGTGADPV
ncbi:MULTISPECIES: TetR/AcrR family transcriptional regulator [Actinomycetes]|uniref:TetR/AcrR family transcriptional regulator n=1 Tax=Actinomycetes TaxID=1760 RepID=UPI0009DCF448|nr:MULTISPECIES: TetR/AcrR family transcriptional regulator [Actinomycetes]